MFIKEIITTLEVEQTMLIERKRGFEKKILDCPKDNKQLVKQYKMSLEYADGRLYEVGWMLDRLWEMIKEHLNKGY